MMKIKKLLPLTILLSVLISCANFKNSNNIDGIYLKTEGNGTVFENASLKIEKTIENTYEITGYKSNGMEEWQQTAIVQGNDNVIGWTDKWLAITITFEMTMRKWL